MPCDRDFSIIKRELRRHNREYSIQEIKKIIIKCSNQRKFLVVDVGSSSLVYDVKSWWPVHYKKNVTSIETLGKPRNQQTQFAISKFHHFQYDFDNIGQSKASEIINGIVKHTFMMRKNTQSKVNLPEQLLYPNGKVLIKSVKLNDLKKVY